MHAVIRTGVYTPFVVVLYNSKRKTTRYAQFGCKECYAMWHEHSERFSIIADDINGAVYAETWEVDPAHVAVELWDDFKSASFESVPWRGVE